MSKATRCDVCGRSTPDVNCMFQRRKSRWYEYWFDSQGGSYKDLDVCTSCWSDYKYFVQNRLGSKNIGVGEV